MRFRLSRSLDIVAIFASDGMLRILILSFQKGERLLFVRFSSIFVGLTSPEQITEFLKYNRHYIQRKLKIRKLRRFYFVNYFTTVHNNRCLNMLSLVLVLYLNCLERTSFSCGNVFSGIPPSSFLPASLFGAEPMS